MGEGRFERKTSEFRSRLDAVTAADRYHLYVQYACPWAHRTLLARHLLGLEHALSVDVVSWRMQADGSWVFDPAEPGATTDSQMDAESLQEIYHAADPGFAGIGTVPVLWDKHNKTIVNNESRDILRMFDTAFSPLAKRPGRLLPAGLEQDIDAMIDANYESVNNGVYKAGFARTQEAHEEAVDALFGRLMELEEHLTGRDYLVGDGPEVLTEADICLFVTLLRFDVYHTHFKCNIATMRDLPNLWAYIRRIWNLEGVPDTTDLDHIRKHYYWSHTGINPRRIIPRGPPLERLLSSATII